MSIKELENKGYTEIYERALKNWGDRNGTGLIQQYEYTMHIGQFIWNKTPEGDAFWRSIQTKGIDNLDIIYDLYPNLLKPLNHFNNQDYKVRTNGLLAIK